MKTIGLVTFLFLSGIATVALSVYTVQKFTIGRALEEARATRDQSIRIQVAAEEINRLATIILAKQEEDLKQLKKHK